MKFLIFGLALVGLIALPAGSSSERGGTVPLAIMQACERCVEPFFVPTFTVKVLAGELPAKGILQCKGAGTELHCDNGLRLTIEKIAFHR